MKQQASNSYIIGFIINTIIFYFQHQEQKILDCAVVTWSSVSMARMCLDPHLSVWLKLSSKLAFFGNDSV